jgi:rRNA processing protein Gar1
MQASYGEEMKVLGTVQEIACDGKMIVRGIIAPPPRSIVVDNRKRTLGRVRRVFGPVDTPYISIDITKENNLIGMIGKKVYIEGVDDNGKGKRRHRRN